MDNVEYGHERLKDIIEKATREEEEQAEDIVS